MSAQDQLRHPPVADSVATPATVLFVRMWAVAHIIHLVAANTSRLDTPWNVATVACAFALLLRPTSGRIFVLMLVGQICDYVWEMPTSPDHWAMITLVNLVILTTFASRRTFDIHALSGAFPGVRATALVVYGFAALAKYNSSFLDPVTSCANAIASRASFGLADPLRDSGVLGWIVLLTETSVPILLLLRATRRHWVRVAMLFHFTLSVSPVFAMIDFTTALYAIFFLFLADDDIERILERAKSLGSRAAIVRDARRNPPLTAALAFMVFGFIGYASVAVASGTNFVFSQLYAIVILALAVLTWRQSSQTRPLGRVRWIHVPAIALALAWALNPYLGLRTVGVFTMFANLQTESGVANHLFMPSARVVDWQDDLVVLTRSSDPVLQQGAENGLAVPLAELRRMAEQDPSLTVSGSLHGEQTTFGPDGVAWEPLNAWERYMFLFRPVPVGDKPFCSMI